MLFMLDATEISKTSHTKHCWQAMKSIFRAACGVESDVGVVILAGGRAPGRSFS